MTRGPRVRATVGGFTLVEAVVALTLLEIGLVGTVGVVVLAQRAMRRAEVLHRATQEAAAVVDSLHFVRARGGGEVRASWGTLRWSAGSGVIHVHGDDVSGGTLVDWWIPSEVER